MKNATNNQVLKKFISSFLLVFSLLFISSIARSQISSLMLEINKYDDYSIFRQKATDYLDSIQPLTDSLIFYSGSGEYKAYNKFTKDWDNRLYPNKSFSDYYQIESDFYSSISNYDYITEDDWLETGPTKEFPGGIPGTGPVEFITIYDDGTSASTRYMLTGSLNGGLYFSDNFGETWNKTCTDKLATTGVSSAVFAPNDHTIWYASSSGNDRSGSPSHIRLTGGIYKFTSQGQGWTQIADYTDFGNDPNTIIYKLVILKNNSNILFAATNRGIYKCDLSASVLYWDQVYSEFTYDLEVKPGYDQVLYSSSKYTVGTAAFWKILISTDMGETWYPLSYQPINLSFRSDYNFVHLTIEVSKIKPSFLYCHVREPYIDNSTNNKSYYYTDFNIQNWNWNLIAQVIDRENFGWGHAFGVDQISTGLEILSAQGTTIAKINIQTGAVTSQNPVHVDLEDFVYHPYNVGEVWAATHGGVEKFDPNVNRWISKYEGLGIAMVDYMSTSYTNPDHIAVGLYHDGARVSRGEYNYNNWTPLWLGVPNLYLDGQQTIIDLKQPNYCWASGQKGKWGISSDYLETLKRLSRLERSRFETVGNINKVNTTVLFFNKCTTANESLDIYYEEVYRVQNRGEGTLEKISNFQPLFPNKKEIVIKDIITSEINPDLIYIILWEREYENAPINMHIFRTKNANDYNSLVEWEECGLPRQAWISCIEIDPNNEDYLYIVYGSKYGPSDGLVFKADYSNYYPSFNGLDRNLPNTTVKTRSITIEKDIVHGIYLATEFGIFYTNDELLNQVSNQWKLVGKNLPHVPCTGLEINYPSNRLRVGTMGRGVWEIPLPCISASNAFLIESNKVLNKDLRLDRDIIVKAGKTLTINNGAHIYMPANGKIIVEPGAKLYIENATVGSGCDALWQGIQIWGNKNSHQWDLGTGNYAQGYVNLKDATIEEAKVALDLWHPNYWNSMGGIVFAENSHFKNNTRSLHALMYKNFHPVTGQEMDYQAVFKNCDFTLDKFYWGPDEFHKHVDIDQVRGFKFFGCTFGLSTDAPYVNKSNEGIAAYSAGFTVNSICLDNFLPCQNEQPCIFENLRSGISIYNSKDAAYAINIRNSKFQNLVYGIYNEEMPNVTILNNTFSIGSDYWDDLCAFGIEQKYATGFAIENNIFDLNLNSKSENHYGIHTNNTYTVDEIYKNEFYNLDYANFASDRNHVSSTQAFGLQYLCNINDHNKNDIYIHDNDISKIQFMQGNRTLAAGNIFSSDARYHLYNGNPAGFMSYNYFPSGRQIPTLIHDLATIGLTQVNVENLCPIHYGGEKQDVVLTDQERFATEFQFAEAQFNYDNVKALFDNLKDGGSTEIKLNEINSATANDVWALRSSLLGSSPHLSEEVLKATSDRTDILSESTIFEILSANPDELRNEDLMKYLEEKENPLPDYMINILKQLALGVSYRTILESDMAEYDRIRIRAANDLLRNYLNESAINYDNVRNWLDNIGGLNSDYQIIDTYIHENNYASAIALANLLPSLYEFTTDELIKHADYLYLLNLQQILYNQGRNILTLSEEELTNVTSISINNNGVAGIRAIGILAANGVATSVECPKPLNLIPKSNVETDQTLKAKALGIETSVIPNPANQWAEFEYKLPSNESSAEIYIYDANNSLLQVLKVSGKEGKELWNTSSVPSGIYTYLFTSDKIRISGKIIVTH